MTARVCQLCGKGLSRLRVGGDGDYCSKEHRNQHRLRQGMDRLEEASKVTSLMRRRENPRQIAAAQLMRNSAQDPRGFYESKSTPLRTEVAGFALASRSPQWPRVVAGADHYVAPHATRMNGPALTRPADAVRITGRTNLPMAQERRQRLGAKVAQAPIVALRCDLPGLKIPRRDFGMRRGCDARVFLSKAGLTPAGAATRRTLAVHTDPRLVRARAVEGNALRVSIGIGFKIATLKWRGIGSHGPAAVALVFADLPRRLAAQAQNETATPRNLEVGIAMAPARLPVAPGEPRRAQFVYPGGVEHRGRGPANGARVAKRFTDVAWRIMEPQSKRMAVAPPSVGFAKRNGAHLFPLVVLPATAEMTPQVAFSAFVPQEPSGRPTVSFEGAVASAIVGTPVTPPAEAPEFPPAAAKSAAEMVRIEEHFGEGWDDWMGGTAEWKVDVAGVRTGPLALYKPSLELIDYEVEFLARIDTRSLNWVVRAAGLDEYVRCTLTAIPGGELEFSRCTVVGNVAGKEVRSSQRAAGKPRAAMTVGTRVTGDTFAVSVDGTDIDFWNDDRFPMGGIGFMGAPDDRARLYWVRLSSTELTAKEQNRK